MPPSQPLRLLLPILAVLTLAACLGGGGMAQPQATPTPLAARLGPPTPLPTPTPTPPPPALAVMDEFAQQGGLLLVRLVNPPPGEASVVFAGSSYPLLREGALAFAVIGIATDTAAGDYPLAAVAGEETLASAFLSVAATDFPEESISLPPESASLLSDAAAIESERALLAAVYSRFTPQRLWAGPWGLPLPGAITNPFGLLRSINGGPLSPHTGTDFAADLGEPVVSAAAGRVAFASALYLRGNSVVIDHGAGVFSGYHHLSEIAVSPGQEVAQGQLIGSVGATGLVSGAHLHWEAIVHGVRVDPVLWTFRAFDP